MTTSLPQIAGCPLGVVPIVWENVHLIGRTERYRPDHILDEIARLGFAGCQFGHDFPQGPELIAELHERGLRLAEVYAALPCDEDGPAPAAYDLAMTRLELLDRSGGERLVVALDGVPERSAFTSRTEHPDCPTMSQQGWGRLGELLDRIANEVHSLGRSCSFHPHAGTFVENPSETDRLVQLIQPTPMGLCLDVGHYLLGGGDPIEAIRSYGRTIDHIHLKDVDPRVRESLQAGQLDGFEGALQNCVFTELGSGLLPVTEVLSALEQVSYSGWLMLEQDTSWLHPSEASAIALHVARFALRQLP